MRASTLFAVILSLLIGLGAAAGAKFAGLFDPKKEDKAPEQRVATPMVLVSKTTLYESIAVTTDQVDVRPLRPDEEVEYRTLKENKKLLPALANAAYLRVPTKTIIPDRILTIDDLPEPVIPQTLPKDMPADHRLVNVSVLKQNAAGGIIRVGMIVDVVLTSNVGLRWHGVEQRTAVIAKGVRVHLKHDSLWTTLRSNPDGRPISFTLQTNAYRAALITYAQTKGVISLQPSGGPMEMMNMMDKDRIDFLLAGTKSISDADLLEAFGLKSPNEPAQPITTELWNGTRPTGRNVFQSPDSAPIGINFEFSMPGRAGGNMGSSSSSSFNRASYNDLVPSNTRYGSSNNTDDCPTCNKNQR